MDKTGRRSFSVRGYHSRNAVRSPPASIAASSSGTRPRPRRAARNRSRRRRVRVSPARQTRRCARQHRQKCRATAPLLLLQCRGFPEYLPDSCRKMRSRPAARSRPGEKDRGALRPANRSAARRGRPPAPRRRPVPARAVRAAEISSCTSAGRDGRRETASGTPPVAMHPFEPEPALPDRVPRYVSNRVSNGGGEALGDAL